MPPEKSLPSFPGIRYSLPSSTPFANVMYEVQELLGMGAALSPGQKVRVRPGINAPDLPEFSIAGWSGTVSQVSGKKADQKVFIEWDDATISGMDSRYLKACEDKQLYHLMACLTADELEAAE